MVSKLTGEDLKCRGWVFEHRFGELEGEYNVEHCFFEEKGVEGHSGSMCQLRQQEYLRLEGGESGVTEREVGG